MEGISEEENVDGELLWNLEILSELIRCTGKELLPYLSQLDEIVAATISLKCKKAYSRSAKVSFESDNTLHLLVADISLIYHSRLSMGRHCA